MRFLFPVFDFFFPSNSCRQISWKCRSQTIVSMLYMQLRLLAMLRMRYVCLKHLISYKQFQEHSFSIKILAFDLRWINFLLIFVWLFFLGNSECFVGLFVSYCRLVILPLPSESPLIYSHVFSLTLSSCLKVGCYKEICRVLKPGQCFAAYEWCMTDSFDLHNKEHQTIKVFSKHNQAYYR